MHIADPKYLEHIDSSLIRRPKSMIIVDGVTYNGERHLVTYPKISHKTERAIGSFPAKTCEFEIYNPNGTIDLHGKEIAVYRGLIFDEIGTGGWIKVGTFSATDENIKTNINKKTISFKGTDRTLLLDKPYGGRAQWDESMNIDDIVREICTRTGVPLGATLIPLSGYTFSEIPPGLDFDNTTDRQLIAYIAELGGCNARINNDGELIFCGPDSPRTGRTISKEKYKNLSVENSFGPINTISFGHRDYEDAYLYRQEGVTDETMVEWAINDNPLTSIVDKEGLARIASTKFFGRTFVPFEVEDLIDDYIFELNDNITIEKKDGSTVDVTILEMETTSRIKSKFGASVQTPGKTDTALAGGIREQIKKVE
ncbi:MAG: hypothetical protein U0K91_05560, partial [Acutalibacteraceae bacterium]|nr:hypothetical protein [Acutalibacteraceae bacterium]